MNPPVIILARGGSKRIPHKNIKPFCGRPLIYWTLDAARNFERVIVGTDSNEIRDCLIQYPRRIELYERKSVSDVQTSEEAIIDMALHLCFNEFIMLQCTSPLVVEYDVHSALRLYREGYDSVVSGVMQERRIWNKYTMYTEPHKIPTYVMNGAIMISSIDTINLYDSIAGGKCGFYKMPIDTYYDIDTPEEFSISETLLKRRRGENCS